MWSSFAFISALTHVLAHPKAGARQEFVSVRDVTRGVNGYFAEHHPAQHARYTTVDSDGQAPFFPNPAFVPGLPANDLDVQTVARLRQESRGHFDPRGRADRGLALGMRSDTVVLSPADL
ncbi:hypothetical protein AB0B13_29000 [Streptomyces sp. NPDC042898]|uniref:hypothetical protein n=1 Tax=Streptomyces sp. NPDC042898 TaxID=3154334 RepID=UPI0033C083F6